MGIDITYTTGDATAPVGDGHKIIVHVCNDIGGWSKGFVMALSKRWQEPEMKYREWAKRSEYFVLGAVQFVQTTPDTWVANLIGQRDIKKDKDGTPPIRYEAVKEGLVKVATFARRMHASVHMPRIGCGLAGGTWDKMEPIIEETLSNTGVKVTVYDFG